MSTVQDIRFALRQLRRAPGFTATVLLTLALAIGATTAMVSVLRATLLNPTPYPGAAQLVSISDVNLRGIQSNGLVTVARAADLAETPAAGQPLFASSAFYYFDQPALKIGGQPPISTSAIAASGDFFRVLGTAPVLGRVFTPSEDAQGAPETAVISYGLWQRVFAADPLIAGRSVVLAGQLTTILGVMPRQFDYPSGTEVWKPAHLSVRQFNGYRGESTRFVNVVARLNSGFTLAQAQTGASLLAARLARSYAATDAEWGFHLTSLRAEIFGSYREALLLLSAAVGILLLIACSNVAGLQLSRNAARQPEMAVRRALGVSTGRLVRQLFTESLLLLATGAGLGVLLAAALLRVLSTRLPATLISLETPHIDGVTLGVTIAVAFAVGALCALAPALQFGRTPISAGQTRSVAGSTRRFGRGFATLQIALALVLLTLAAGLLKNLYRLLETPLGYDPSHLVTAAIHLPFGSDPVKTHQFYQHFEQRIGALPGVSSVGAIVALPLSNFSSRFKADISGLPLTPHHDTVNAGVRTITPGYLATMRIPLLSGRGFDQHDGDPKASPNTLQVALVNQSFAARYFPHASATGKRLIVVTTNQHLAPIEIIGIIGDVHGEGGDLGSPVAPEIYQVEQGYGAFMTFVVRTTLPASVLAPALRRQLASLNPGAALGTVADFTSLLDHALAQPRLNSGLLSALALLALLLVLIGVYGVIAYSVAQRTRELAVRLALGSSKRAIFAMLLRESTSMLAAGLALGLAGSFAATRLLETAFGPHALSSASPLASRPAASTIAMLTLTSALLASAVYAASLLPARRAASIDPMQALRSE